MLDFDIADFYGISTTRLNQQFRRNRKRFPEDFAFLLNKHEFDSLMLQNATSKKGRGGRRKVPVAFTEHGVIMLASVLNCDSAVKASIQVVRVFVKLRETLAANRNLSLKLMELERKIETHDEDIRNLFSVIKELMSCPEEPKKQIGFTADK